jgi:hypothetical protein
MTDLSPAAQALLDEYSAAADFTFDPSIDFWGVKAGLAAALRALATRINGADAIRQDILAIAAELSAKTSCDHFHPIPHTMSNPYRNALVDLYAASQLYTGLNPAAADVCPAELVRRLMEAMAASAALLAQPELPELTDEVLTMTYAYAVAAAVGNRRGPYKLEDAEAAQLAGLRAAIAADRARRIP